MGKLSIISSSVLAVLCLNSAFIILSKHSLVDPASKAIVFHNKSVGYQVTCLDPIFLWHIDSHVLDKVTKSTTRVAFKFLTSMRVRGNRWSSAKTCWYRENTPKFHDQLRVKWVWTRLFLHITLLLLSPGCCISVCLLPDLLPLTRAMPQAPWCCADLHRQQQPLSLREETAATHL